MIVVDLSLLQKINSSYTTYTISTYSGPNVDLFLTLPSDVTV